LYCVIIALLTTYKVPELLDIQGAKAESAIESAIVSGYLALKTWEKSPSIGWCVDRIEEMMRSLEIKIPS
jgi:hypothetical protein